MDSTFTHSRRAARLPLAGLLMIAVVALPGCRWWPMRQESEIPAYTEMLSKDELVRSLNANIEPLESWRCTDATVKTRGGMMDVLGLKAHIAVERPRNFRMLVKLMTKNMADLGSNDERFWFWFDGHPQRRTFTAQHANAEYAQRVLQIPFEPDWLLEALGVVPLNPDEFQMVGDGSNGTVSLVSERMTSSGRIVRRVVLVDARRRLITAHALYDGSSPTQGWIARATLSNHWRDPASGLVLPRQIDLEWPQHDLFLTITMNHIEVNPQFPGPTFALPDNPDYPAYEIAGPPQPHGLEGQAGAPFHASSADAGSAYVSDGDAQPGYAPRPAGNAESPFPQASEWTAPDEWVASESASRGNPSGGFSEPRGFAPVGRSEPQFTPLREPDTAWSSFGNSEW